MTALLTARALAVPDCAPPYDGETGSAAAIRTVLPPVPAVALTGTAPSDDWPRRFAQLLLETMDGSRPSRQLFSITTSRVREHLRDIAPMLTGGHRPRVARVITTYPAPGVAEASVIVSCGTRIRALALRLERTPQDQWMCTDVEAG